MYVEYKPEAVNRINRNQSNPIEQLEFDYRIQSNGNRIFTCFS